MTVDEIKEIINHDQLVEEGWHLAKIRIGFFKRYGNEKKVPVLMYKKKRYADLEGISILLGYYVRYYNEFGFIHGEDE